MSETKKQLWLRALVASIITGASTSGLAALGTSVADAAGAGVGQLNIKQLCVMALSGGIIGLLAYLKQSPVPPPEE
jgi:hypothetical protein